MIEEETSVPITDSFDLHSFLSRDVGNALSDYLDEAVKRSWREVRIIHGKGKGIRRAEVRRLLSKDPRVLEFYDAPPGRGAYGATVVLLKS